MVRSQVPLGPALLFTAVVTIAVGTALYLLIDETLGAVIAALGLLDLLTTPLVLRLIRRNAARQPSAEGSDAPAQPDPDYNPYAREE